MKIKVISCIVVNLCYKIHPISNQPKPPLTHPYKPVMCSRIWVGRSSICRCLLACSCWRWIKHKVSQRPPLAWILNHIGHQNPLVFLPKPKTQMPKKETPQTAKDTKTWQKDHAVSSAKTEKPTKKGPKTTKLT